MSLSRRSGSKLWSNELLARTCFLKNFAVNNSRLSRSVSMGIWDGSYDLEWHWKAGQDGSNSQADLLNIARTIWPRTTKFGRITRGGGACFSGSDKPHPRGAGSQRSPIWRVPFYLCVHPSSRNYQIWHGNTSDGVLGSATPPIPGERSNWAPQFWV